MELSMVLDEKNYLIYQLLLLKLKLKSINKLKLEIKLDGNIEFGLLDKINLEI